MHSLDPDQRRPTGKPHGGLWTCPEDPAAPDTSPWCEHPAARRHRWDRLWRLTAPRAQLLVIATADDLAETCRRYPSDFLVAVGLRPHVLPATWDRIRLPELDHAAIMADGYDGLEVTQGGLEASTAHGEDWDPLVLDGYDVPSILWYRWVFRGAPEAVAQPDTGARPG